MIRANAAFNIGAASDAALADALAARDWPRALMWLYVRLLLRLDAAGAIRVQRHGTARSYLRQAQTWAGDAPERRAMATALASTADAYQRMRFGHGGADAALVETLRAQQLALAEAAT